MMASCSKKNIDLPLLNEEVAPLYDSALKPFYHGVASGDPLMDRVIIWTRVTPTDSVSSILVTWEVAEDINFSAIYRSDTLRTSPLRDYTVKVDVDSLKPGRFYYYRFKAFGKNSIVGRTKTTQATGTNPIKLAVASCSNWEFGYFNAYEMIAQRELDAVVHLGDYIYEYATGGYGDTTIGRKNVPSHEIVTLKDYRTRYSQYHTDRGLRAARQQHPFITIWDDHEVANNVYKTGAENHQGVEGNFEKRKADAKQAYYEWLPIREAKYHYRSFSFGSLLDLIMLDERLEGRTKPAESITDPQYNNDAQSMLGEDQLLWLESTLEKSKATWKVIGNQVIFSEVDQSGPFPKQPRNLDSWDGYPIERNKLASFIQEKKVSNLLFITGDTHAAWAFEVTNDSKSYDSKTSKGAFAVEFGTTSITSSNWNEYTSDDTVRIGEAQLLKSNPHLKYGNARDHGYLLLTLSQEKAIAEWWYVQSLREVLAAELLGKQMIVREGTHRLLSN